MEKKIVKEIMDTLLDRGGFDAWWEEIGSENRKEIKKELLNIIYKNLKTKLLDLNPQIIENSKYTNPFLYEDIKKWYNKLDNL